ncbi:transglycosylase domain-containing protein [Catellatospora aurea]|uniref:Transglycosylase domain-containing protein n=1 Tax=Catellatospora aurea TaxID=1337874 RepID=A0ABW2H445_9ACTN
MTLVELPKSAAGAMPPSSQRGLHRLMMGAVALLLLLGVTFGLAEYYYASVPIPREKPGSTQVRAENLRPGVADVLVAAVDPDFHQQSGEIMWPSTYLTKRYTVVAMGTSWDDLDSWRVRVGAHKLEGWYTKAQLLDFYLNTAHYGQGAIGLVDASMLYFGKHPRDLTVTEAALLGVHLDPDPGDVAAAWNRVLDTMVEHGWLTAGERARLVIPKTIQR